MFAFYAESRDLLQPDSAANQRTYRIELSLLELRDEIIECGDTPAAAAETYLEDSTTHWARLDTFFRIIDQGKSSIGMTAYDGGLFDRGEHTFLNEHSVSNHISRRSSTSSPQLSKTAPLRKSITPISAPDTSGASTKACSNTNSKSRTNHASPSKRMTQKSGKMQPTSSLLTLTMTRTPTKRNHRSQSASRQQGWTPSIGLERMVYTS